MSTNMCYVRKNDIEPKISLDEILNFISFYSYKKLGEGTLYFNDGIEFKSTNSIKFFNTLLLLHLESAITLDIKGQHINDFGRKNKILDESLNKFKKKENYFLGIFKRKSHFSIGGGYDINGLQLNWGLVSKDIKYLDCIEYNLDFNKYQFFILLFCKITEYLSYKNIDRELTGKKLYKNILEQTGGKNNNLGEIIIFYDFFTEYLENKRLVFPILSELENKNKLFIKNITIKDREIYFKISKINDISEELFLEISKSIKDYGDGKKSNIENIEYTKEGVKINGNIWIPKNSEKSEKFLYILSNFINDNNNIKKISINKLVEYYEENLDKLLDKIPKEKRLKYLRLTEDNIKNSYLKTISKKIKEEYTENLLEIERGLIISKKIEKD